MQRAQPGQRYWAELIGTFAIVFVACGALISERVSNGAVTIVGGALAQGLMVALMVYGLGPISAAHFNPAITLGFAVARRFPRQDVGTYWVVQSTGGLLACTAHWVIFGPAAVQQAYYGALFPSGSVVTALFLEVIVTFVLLFVMMIIATDRRIPGAVDGLAIGLTVTLCILCGSAVSGASMNPARSLAPALFVGAPALRYLLIYLVGPAVGAILAAWSCAALQAGQTYAQARRRLPNN